MENLNPSIYIYSGVLIKVYDIKLDYLIYNMFLLLVLSAELEFWSIMMGSGSILLTLMVKQKE